MTDCTSCGESLEACFEMGTSERCCLGCSHRLDAFHEALRQCKGTGRTRRDAPVPPAEPVERDGDKLVLRGELWDAINRYVQACGGKPEVYIYGNTLRMDAVVDVERAVDAIRSRPAAKGKAPDCPTCARGVPCIDHLDTRHPGAIANNAAALPAGAVDEREALELAEIRRRAAAVVHSDQACNLVRYSTARSQPSWLSNMVSRWGFKARVSPLDAQSRTPDRAAEPEKSDAALFYEDAATNPCSLDQLCEREPAWAANRIRVMREQLRSRPAAKGKAVPAGAVDELPCFHCGMSLRDCANLEDPTCCRNCAHPAKGTP